MNTKRNHAYNPVSRGTRTRAAGEIFPYMVVIQGNFIEGFKYHLTGQGIKMNERVHGSYVDAHNEAIDILNNGQGFNQ